jgi:formylglycine-generating enzyme required for sulfatase activity
MKSRLWLSIVSCSLALIAIGLIGLWLSPTAQARPLAQPTPNPPGQPTVSRDVVSPSGYDLTTRPRRALNAAPGLVASTTTTSTVYLPLVKNDQPSMPGMVFIPAGNFKMGCDQAHNGGELCNGDELLHTVYLDAYQIDKNLVTTTQYAQCVAAGHCTAPGDTSSNLRLSYYGNSSYSNYPVIHVNWDQSNAYCAWAGKRLPSEAEWEKAARGSSDTRAYPWGDATPTCALANSNYCVNDTSAVGSYPSGASPYGVLDMAGNVWEWVNDWFDSSYYSVSPPSNPPGPTTSPYNGRVLRGGYWYDNAYGLRVADRHYYNPTYQGYIVGFRCAARP